jgi:TonB-dependent SusC/RagA subfamily outer membrane receptor
MTWTEATSGDGKKIVTMKVDSVFFDGKAKVAVPAHGKVSNIHISVDTVSYKTITDNKKNSNVSAVIVRTSDDKVVEESKKDPQALTITFVQKTTEKTELPKDVLYIIDGKEMESGSMKDIDPNTIKSINVLKGETALKLYGEKGKNGVIEITTKKN